MSAQLGYQYLVLRIVPSAVREEFLNVGVVLYCQKAEFLALAWDVNDDRLRAFAPTLDPEDVRAALRTAEVTCREGRVEGRPELPGLGRRFGWLAAPRSTVLRAGPTHGGMTSDPAAELDRLRAVVVSL